MQVIIYYNVWYYTNISIFKCIISIMTGCKQPPALVAAENLSRSQTNAKIIIQASNIN